MASLDDITILQKFVKGETTLLCNSNLQIESASAVSQLLAKNRKLIAIIKLVNNLKSAWVKQKSEYWELLDQVLRQDNFVPLGIAEKEGLMLYEQHEIPVGYKMHYTLALDVWKAWWSYQRGKKPSSTSIEILIFLKKKWSPIREVSFSDGILFIKTPVAEMTLHSDDQVVWLSKQHQALNPQASLSHPLITAPENQASALNPVVVSSPIGNSSAKSQPITAVNTEVAAMTRNHYPGNVQRIHQEVTTATTLDNVLQFSREWQAYASNAPQNLAEMPDQSQVVKFMQGRLYIQTAIGEIIVEGSDYRFRINQ